MNQSPTTCLVEAIETFHDALPGWWFSIGDCSVSADASCGPDRQGEDAWLLANRAFDDGFHADLSHPSSMAEALTDVMLRGALARAEAVRRADGKGK